MLDNLALMLAQLGLSQAVRDFAAIQKMFLLEKDQQRKIALTKESLDILHDMTILLNQQLVIVQLPPKTPKKTEETAPKPVPPEDNHPLAAIAKAIQIAEENAHPDAHTKN